MEKMSYPVRGVLLTAVAFLLMVGTLWLALGQVDHKSNRAEITALEDAVRRAAVLCYSVEGRYPSDVEELRENYGLSYNRERFIVTLDAFASNLLPDINVLTVGGAEGE